MMFVCYKKNKILFAVGILGILLLVLAFGIAGAQTYSNLRIFYQGTLMDPEGNPVEDGRYNMRFLIYDAPEEGNIVWQEEYSFYDAVFVREGRFQVILGRKNPINLDFDKGPFWLGIMMGEETETGDIVWNIGKEPRKEIISLSQVLEDEKQSSQNLEDLSEIVKEKIGDQSNVVIVFNLEELEKIKNKNTGGSGISLGVFQGFLNFIGDKLSFIIEELAKIGEKIDAILSKLGEITNSIVEIGKKIDVLYKVLIIDKGLAPKEEITPSPGRETENVIYTKKKVENLILKGGERSVKIINDSIKPDSLIFVSFLNDPGSAWWISEKQSGYFILSLKDPAPIDLQFSYWILNKEEPQKENPPERTPLEIPELGSQENSLPPQNSTKESTSSVSNFQNSTSSEVDNIETDNIQGDNSTTSEINQENQSNQGSQENQENEKNNSFQPATDTTNIFDTHSNTSSQTSSLEE